MPAPDGRTSHLVQVSCDLSQLTNEQKGLKLLANVFNFEERFIHKYAFLKFLIPICKLFDVLISNLVNYNLSSIILRFLSAQDTNTEHLDKPTADTLPRSPHIRRKLKLAILSSPTRKKILMPMEKRIAR